MSEPLFILAPPRSFTSVICAMVGNHPQMMGLPETNLFAADTYDQLTRIHQKRPRFAHGLLRSVAELGLGGQSEEDVVAARVWLEEHRDMTTADIYRDLMDWASPRAVIDKSPMYVYSSDALERIKDAFPEARFLHLARHPRATCASIFETRQMSEQMTESEAFGGGEDGDWQLTPEQMWLNPHLRIIEALESVPYENKMLLRGESLMVDPRNYLTQIAEWLGIRTDDEALDAMLRPQDSPFACYGPDSARLGNDPRFLEGPELRPYREKPSDLDSPMAWDSSMYFDEVTQHYAMYFGY